MSRRTVVSALAGALLIGGLSAPALADPVVPVSSEPTVVCVRLDSESGKRDGVCVWLPVRR